MRDVELIEKLLVSFAFGGGGNHGEGEDGKVGERNAVWEMRLLDNVEMPGDRMVKEPSHR